MTPASTFLFGQMSEFGLLCVFGAFVLVSMAFTFMLGCYKDRRLAELELADQALEDHFEAAERVISDPATPTILVEALVAFSTSIGREEIALPMANALLCQEQRLNLTPQQAAFRARLNEAQAQLEQHRMDLVTDFGRAVDAGFNAARYRWPSVKPALDRLANRRSWSRREETAEAVALAPEIEHQVLCGRAA